MTSIILNRMICCRILGIVLLILGTLLLYTNNGHLTGLIQTQKHPTILHTQRQLKQSSEPENRYPHQLGTPPVETVTGNEDTKGYLIIPMEEAIGDVIKCWADRNRLKIMQQPITEDRMPSDIDTVIAVQVTKASKDDSLLPDTATQQLQYNESIPIRDIIADMNQLIASEYNKYLIVVKNWPKTNKEQLNKLSEQLECGNTDEEITHRHIEDTATQYIKTMYGNESYIAIVLSPKILEAKSFSKCLEQVTAKYHKLQTNHSTMKAFVTILGGDDEIYRLIPFKMFFRSIYWMSNNIDKWRNDMKIYTHGMNMEQQSEMVKVIASRATCVLVAGDISMITHGDTAGKKCTTEVEECK